MVARELARRAGRRLSPAVDELEGRRLLSTSSSQAALVQRCWHKFHEYAGEMQRIELKSQATPDESQALSDVAHTIGAETTASGLLANAKANDASRLLDRAPLYGWLSEQGWANVRNQLSRDLNELGVSDEALIQALAAMHAVANSAGVTSHDYNVLLAKEGSYARARGALIQHSTANFPEPQLYYQQHLRGFFRGGAVDRRQAGKRLDADIRSIARTAGDSPAQVVLLQRNAKALEQVGAPMTSSSRVRLGELYVGTFADGSPSDQALATLDAGLHDLLGPNASANALKAADELVADARDFFNATGSSQAAVQTITNDVLVFVAAGGGANHNLFRVQI